MLYGLVEDINSTMDFIIRKGGIPACIDMGKLVYENLIREINLRGMENKEIMRIMKLDFRRNPYLPPDRFRVLTQRYLEMEKENVEGKIKRKD